MLSVADKNLYADVIIKFAVECNECSYSAVSQPNV